ncbi:MAG: hypothetical protein ACYTGC_01255 [Planctomycetota bacterium]|jgi:hypothetical protein
MKVNSLAIMAGLGGTLIAAGSTSAAILGLSRDLIAQPTIDGVDYDVWRVYAEVDNPLDQITFVSGNSGTPLIIVSGSPDGFYQNETFGPNQTEPNAALFAVDPDLEWDSYLTIGRPVLDADVGPTPLQAPRTDNPLWFCDRFMLTNGAWYRTPDDPASIVGDELRLMVGQFTVPRGATLGGTLRVSGFFDGDASNFPYVLTVGDPLCDGDVNDDGQVDVEDLLEVIFQFGSPCEDMCACPSDVNRDDSVDVEDMLQVVFEWGPCLP